MASEQDEPAQRSYFGLNVIAGRFVRLDDIEQLPFASFWKESARGSTYQVTEDGDRLIFLRDWEAFAELFIKTGKHRYQPKDQGA